MWMGLANESVLRTASCSATVALFAALTYPRWASNAHGRWSMQDDPRPIHDAGAAVQPRSQPLPPAETSMAPTERLLVALIIAVSVGGVLLLARATVVLFWRDTTTYWPTFWPPRLAPRESRLFVLVALLFWGSVFSALITFVHECAHALGGRLAGFWLASIQVGVFKLTRTNRGLQLSLSAEKWVGGRTVSYPVGDHDLRLRYALFVAMGPLSGLLLGFLGAELAHAALTAFPPNTFAAASFDGLAAFSFISFIENLIPIKLRRLKNDGWSLLQLLISGRTMERAIVFSTLRGYTLRDVPLLDRPPSLVPRALALARGRPKEHLAAVYAYSLALARGDVETAGRMLDRAIATAAPPAPSATLAHEVAYFEARHRGRPEAARAWLERAASDRFSSIMRPRATAAILLAEGRYAEARAQAAEGLIAREAYAHSTGRRNQEEEESLRAMFEEAQRALT
jgi:hypothetical protein